MFKSSKILGFSKYPHGGKTSIYSLLHQGVISNESTEIRETNYSFITNPIFSETFQFTRLILENAIRDTKQIKICKLVNYILDLASLVGLLKMMNCCSQGGELLGARGGEDFAISFLATSSSHIFRVMRFKNAYIKKNSSSTTKNAP